MSTLHSIKQYIKENNISGIDGYTISNAAAAEDLFAMFVDKTDFLEFDNPNGDGSSVCPSVDARCIVAAILTAATLIAPK